MLPPAGPANHGHLRLAYVVMSAIRGRLPSLRALAKTQSGNLRKYAPYAFSFTFAKGLGIPIVNTVSFNGLFWCIVFCIPKP